MENLSEHFSYDEGVRSSTAEDAGIDNSPNVHQLTAMRIAAQGMEQVRLLLGVPCHVDSWLRVEALERLITRKGYVAWCERHDHEVNDLSWSMYFSHKAHPRGYAVDFIAPGFGSPLDIVRAIEKSDIKFDQLIMEGSWVHISFAPEMRGEVLAATFINGVPTYSKGA